MEPEALGRLTARQKQCLRLLYERHDAKGIARSLGITAEGVHYHLREARRVLGVSRSLEAARLYADHARSVGDYDPVVGDRMVVEHPPGIGSFEPVTTRCGDGFEAAEEGGPHREGEVIREAIARYDPPREDRSVAPPLPFPTARRPHNDLTPPSRLAMIVLCATVILVGSVGLLATAHAAQQLCHQILAPYFKT